MGFLSFLSNSLLPQISYAQPAVAIFGGPVEESTPDATPFPSPAEINDYSLYLVALVMLFGLVALAFFVSRFARNKREGKDRESYSTIFENRQEHAQDAPPGSGHRVLNREIKAAKYSGITPAIFISYRRDDTSDVSGRIYDRLTQHFGKNAVFKDVDSIPLGVDFRKHLGNSVGQCDVLLTVIGRQWLAGEGGKRSLDDVRDFVRIEIEAALQRDIPVVPVLVQGASIPNPEDLPEILQSLVYRNGIPVRPDPDFHQDMDRLIKGIEGYLKEKANN